jgi:predicted nucleic acid-binding protein
MPGRFVNYLLDTNAISEATHKKPDTGIMEWMAAADEDSLFLSVVTITELRYGIERLPHGKRRRSLEDWVGRELSPRFEPRILSDRLCGCGCLWKIIGTK